MDAVRAEIHRISELRQALWRQRPVPSVEVDRASARLADLYEEERRLSAASPRDRDEVLRRARVEVELERMIR